MGLDEIIRDLNAKKAETGLTNQQISELSQIPKSTVDRVLRGGPEEPRAQTLLSIAEALDFKLAPVNKPTVRGDSYAAQIAELYEARIADLKKQLILTRAEKDRAIRNLCWIVALLVLGVVTALLVGRVGDAVAAAAPA